VSDKRAHGVLYGVGVGPGDPRLLTLRAVEVLRAVDVIFHVIGPRSRGSVSAQIVDALGECKARREELLFSMSNDLEERTASVASAAEHVVAALKDGEDCAFATIGDPLVYSTFGYLQRRVRSMLPDVKIEIIPGITSFQAAAAASGEPLVEDDEVLSVIPKWGNGQHGAAVLHAADTAVLLKAYRNRTEAVDALQDEMGPERIVYAARVGQDNETIIDNIDEIKDQQIDYMSLLIARRKKDD